MMFDSPGEVIEMWTIKESRFQAPWNVREESGTGRPLALFKFPECLEAHLLDSGEG